MTFLLIGALIWSYLSMIFDILSETVQWERWEGTIEYTFMSPTSRVTHLLGMGVYAIVYGIIRTALVLGVAMLAFDLDLSQRQLLGRPGRPRRMQHLARGFRGGRRRDAAALAGEGPAGDVHRLGHPAPRLGRLLPRQACSPGGCRSLAQSRRSRTRLEGSRAALQDGVGLSQSVGQHLAAARSWAWSSCRSGS